MSLEWIRCNKCFVSLKSMKVGCTPFSLTQCGHIFCQQCIQLVLNTTECFECKTVGVQALQLTDSLPGAVKHIFEPLPDVCERMVLGAKFQSTQMMILHKRFEVMEKKYYQLKMTYMKQYKQLEECKATHTRIMNSRQPEFPSPTTPPSNNPRKYFDSSMFMQSSEVKRAHRRNFPHLQQNYHMNYQSDDNYLTDSSNTTTSTVRTARRIDQTAPDEIFRIPKSRRVPRSTGVSSHSSSGMSSIDGSTPARNNIFQ